MPRHACVQVPQPMEARTRHLLEALPTGVDLALTKTMPATRPTRMEARFSRFHGTLNATKPMSATGILFRLPTRLYEVAVVVDRNHSDAKLIPNATCAHASRSFRCATCISTVQGPPILLRSMHVAVQHSYMANDCLEVHSPP